MDLYNYFESNHYIHVRNFFLKDLQMSEECSELLAHLCTFSVKKDNNRKLCRGFSSSGILAFCINIKIFKEIEEHCIQNNSTFSLYVDDMFFCLKTSERKQIKEFINYICNIVNKSNYLKINFNKITYKKSFQGIMFHNLFLVNGKLFPATKKRKEMKSKIYKGYKMQMSKFNKP